MKKLILLILLFSFYLCGYPQSGTLQIKDLHTTAEVNDFLHSVSKYYNTINESLAFDNTALSKLARIRHIHSWYIADLDHSGTPDLLVMVDHRREPFVVLDIGQGKYKQISLCPSCTKDYCFAKIDTIDNKACILLTTVETSSVTQDVPSPSSYETHSDKIITDTLIYNFGGFVEYNSTPAQLSFTHLEVKTKWVGGEMTMFTPDLTIDSRGFATKAQSIGDNVKGERFKAVIDPKKLQEIQDILNYIDATHTAPKHRVANQFDHAETMIEIEYNGITTKLPYLGNHFGADQLVKLLNQLKNQKWVIAE